MARMNWARVAREERMARGAREEERWAEEVAAFWGPDPSASGRSRSPEPYEDTSRRKARGLLPGAAKVPRRPATPDEVLRKQLLEQLRACQSGELVSVKASGSKWLLLGRPVTLWFTASESPGWRYRIVEVDGVAGYSPADQLLPTDAFREASYVVLELWGITPDTQLDIGSRVIRHWVDVGPAPQGASTRKAAKVLPPHLRQS